MKKYSLASDSWGWGEKLAILKVMASGRYTMGERVRQFEDEFAKKVGSSHAVMVNSGSSANLVLVSALIQGPFDLRPGDEVIVPAVSWSTTYFPLTQMGLVPVFVDVDSNCNIDVFKVRKAITSRTRAIFAVNLLGMPADLSILRDICTSNKMILIEDNCESYGATLNGKYAGTYGLGGTFSFFFSHHLQTMEGGMIVTDNAVLADYMRSIRAHGWVRDLRTDVLYKKSGDPFEDSFKFVTEGYCVRPLEMSGAIGSVQLKKMNKFIEYRRDNAETFQEEFSDLQFGRQTEKSGMHSSWFGFAVILPKKHEGKRKKIIDALKAENIETRPIVTGNFLNQPVINKITHKISGELTNAEYLDKNGFFFGNDHRDLGDNIRRARHVIGEALGE
jgi:CDP-6-deoxy-D-xylo-4-hexulose-3-dehydrase